MQLLDGPWPARITWALLPLAVGPALGDALDGEHPRGRPHGRRAGLGDLGRDPGRRAHPAHGEPHGAADHGAGSPPSSPTGLRWPATAGAADVVAVAWAALTRRGRLLAGNGRLLRQRLVLRRRAAHAPAGAGRARCSAPSPSRGWRRWPPRSARRSCSPRGSGWRAGVLVVVGVPLAAVAIRALHGLSRRWVVFVPAGVVLHDLQALVDPVLFPRTSIRRLGPAPADGDGAVDLTQGSLGLALELELVEPTEIAPPAARPHRAGRVRRADPLHADPPRRAARRGRPPPDRRRLTRDPTPRCSAAASGDQARADDLVAVVEHHALPGATRRDGSSQTTSEPSTRHGRGAPWALTCARSGPATGDGRPREVGEGRRGRCSRSASEPTVTVRGATSTPTRVPGLATAGEPEAVALAERDQLDRGHRADRSRRPCRRPRPGVVGIRSPRKAARPPVAVMKQTSWLSGLSAVASPSRAAAARTSALVRSPTGNRHAARARPASSMCST